MTHYTQQRREEQTATIANGQTTSDAINCLGKSIVGLIMPAAFTGTTLTIQSSFDGSTFKDAYDGFGNQITINVGTSRHIHLSCGDFLATKYIKLVSGSSEGAEREITVILMGV